MLAAATLLFTTLDARLALRLGWVARLQIFPLAMAGAFTALAAWLLATLLFGRVYCSSVCPMGALQDIFSRIPTTHSPVSSITRAKDTRAPSRSRLRKFSNNSRTKCKISF